MTRLSRLVDSGSLSLILALLVAPVLAFACGGQTTSSGGHGGPGSSSSSGGASGSSGGASGSTSGSTSGGEPVDATPATDSQASIVCTSNGISSSSSSSGGQTDGGPPPCITSASETCSDGNTYHVGIQCPNATAVCYVTSSSGGSGGGTVMYPGCPSCTQLSVAYSVCGFPQ